MTKRLLIAAGLLLCLTLAGGDAQAQTGAARGKVLDEAGQPLADAKVEIDFQGGVTRKFETKTNKKGEFTQVGVSPGVYRITASKEGFQASYIDVKIPIGEPLYVPDFKLKALGSAAAAPGQPDIKGQFKKALDLTQEGKLDEAEALYKEILTKAPSLAEVYYNLGFIYSQKKDWAQAETAFQKALELRPDYSDATVALAKVYMDSGQGAKGLELMQKAAEGTTDGRVLFNLGVFHLNSGRYDEAMQAFVKAETLDPQNAETQYYIGTLLVGQNKIPDSIARLEKYLSMSPQNPQNVATAQGLLAALKPKK